MTEQTTHWNERTIEWKKERMNEWTDKRTYERTKKRMNNQPNVRRNERTQQYLYQAKLKRFYYWNTSQFISPPTFIVSRPNKQVKVWLPSDVFHPIRFPPINTSGSVTPFTKIFSRNLNDISHGVTALAREVALFSFALQCNQRGCDAISG